MLQENIHTFFKPLYLITLAESLGGVESLVCHPASMPHASMQYSISVENQPYPVLCTLSADGCTAHGLVPSSFSPHIAGLLGAASLGMK